ncbi:MAG: GTP cyclohydrolase FolE2 [Planctomycetota bacterium]|jgi:GTP cyclohydrolase I
METRIETLADIQSSLDLRRIPIDRVGVRGLRHPVRVKDRCGGEQSTVATFTMNVSLPHEFKGTHMSRFVEILNADDGAISVESFLRMPAQVARRLDAAYSHVEMTFPYFISKSAPVTGVHGMMDYEVTFIGELSPHGTCQQVRVLVPVTSLCPCSKEISAEGAHNQRGHVTVTVELRKFVWIEEIVDVVEQAASCELYGVLKRPDEKHVTERAFDNPKFVEDIARDVAVVLNEDPRIGRYSVEVENFESIHNHNAYAQVVGRGKA